MDDKFTKLLSLLVLAYVIQDVFQKYIQNFIVFSQHKKQSLNFLRGFGPKLGGNIFLDDFSQLISLRLL